MNLDSQQHGGNLRELRATLHDGQDLLDFSASINPLGPPAWLRPVLSAAVSDVRHYPEPYAETAVDVK